MAQPDRAHEDLKLYIGGLFTLRRKEALRAAGITHVLSILRLPLEEKLFEDYKHFVVEVDDVDDENLLEHFEDCNRFIQDGLDAGGGVLVHCAMGKSRSATCVCAYLMSRLGLSPDEALSKVRENRPLCEPNDGFWKQLELYHEMQTPTNIGEHPAYQRWLYQQEVAMSRACGQAPEAEKIRFEDEHSQGFGSADFEMRCKKCRRTLATSQYVVQHKPSNNHSKPDRMTTSSACAHYFLDPLSWMRPELEQGKLDGRLECPKCKTNIGKYAWQGMQCSCGDWIVPGISLAKGRIDEARSKDAQGDLGIRKPPLSTTTKKSILGHENL